MQEHDCPGKFNHFLTKLFSNLEIAHHLQVKKRPDDPLHLLRLQDLKDSMDAFTAE